MSLNIFGTFSEAIACDSSLRLYGDASRCISLVFGGSNEMTQYRRTVQPLVVPISTGNVNLPYFPNQLVMKSGYFSLRSCYFRCDYPVLDENTAPYVRFSVVLYLGTKNAMDYALFRSHTTIFKGGSAEVNVPDVDRLSVPAGKNVFVDAYVTSQAGTSYRYAVDFRYCMTFDD